MREDLLLSEKDKNYVILSNNEALNLLNEKKEYKISVKYDNFDEFFKKHKNVKKNLLIL